MKKMKKMGDKGKSSPLRVDVGSGSRPGKSKIHIPTSEPTHKHQLERAPKNWLK